MACRRICTEIAIIGSDIQVPTRCAASLVNEQPRMTLWLPAYDPIVLNV
jgi:hypothetical protein